MDLQLYLRVLWRFRILVIGGFLFALSLAAFSIVRVSFDGGLSFSYRAKEQWAAYERLFVTTPGFPWGSSMVESAAGADARIQADRLGAQREAEARLTTLAFVYSQLVDSDAVRALMRQTGPIQGAVEAAPVLTPDGDSALPLISIAGLADSPERATGIAERASAALREYITEQQTRDGTPSDQRVVLEVLENAGGEKLLAARPVTPAIVVFLTVMIACFGLVFVLENMRPRVRAIPRDEVADTSAPGAAGQRRLA